MKHIYLILTKRLLATSLVIFLSMISYATTYYVSSAGNDLNTGLTTTSPWKTLSKINTVTLKAGDNVLFRRGDTFTGSLIPKNSGTSTASILFGAYGTGSRPVISGFESVTGWTLVGNGIYSAPSTAKTTLNMLTVNGVNTPMGRFPKKDWLTFESFSGRTSITDNQLTSSPNWTGAEVVIRKSNWTIDRSKITNHTGTIISYTSGSSWDVTSSGSYNYFIQNHIGTLTQLGDWFCDGTKLNMFFGSNNPSSYSVKASVVDKLVDASSRAYLVFDNIKFEGANVKGIVTSLSMNISVKNCDFSMMGDNAIHSVASQNTLIENSNFDNCNGSSIYLNAANSKIRNNFVSNGGLIPGMGNVNGDTYNGIVFYGAGSICEYNTVKNVGYNGIMFYSNNSEVRYNLVDGFCVFLTDGGGIYTYYGGDVNFIQTGMKMYNNVVINGGGNGLYSDGITNNLEIFNNTVAHVGKWGIHMNEPRNNKVHDNVLYNCTGSGIDISNQYHLEVSASGNIISTNTIVQGASTELMVTLSDARTYNVGAFGTSDKNVFIIGANGLKVFKTQVSQPSFKLSSYDLASWKAFSSQELSSQLKVVDLTTVRVEYNATNAPVTVTLSSPMIDSKGVKYSKSVILPAYSSVVLLKDNTVAPVLFTEYKSICDGTNYNGWTVAGKYERTLVAKSGGDSIVTTNLTVNPKYNVSENITINEGDAYKTWTKSGQYSRTLSSVAGCDSIVTTNLTVASLPLTTEETLISQTIELKKGYNIVSTYVMASNPTVDFVTKPLSDKGYLVKVQDENGNSFENWGNLGGWMNKVGSIEKTEGYKVQVTENCTLTITGRPVALPLDIPLNAGWNIISFPQTTMLDAMSIIQSLIDQNKLIKVQDEVGNSIEDWGVYGGWKNGIGNFQPGKAYKVKMSSDAVLTLKENYTKGVTIQPTAEKTSYFMSKVEGNGSDHMNINITGMSKSGISAGDELAAFDGDICVGTIKVTEDHIFNGIASLVVSNSSDSKQQDGFKAGHEIKVYAWNHTTGDESLVSVEAISGQLVYEKNASILIRTKAQTTSVNALTDLVKVDVFPNPSVGRITVRFAQLPDAGSRIDILDLSGRKITSRIISETSEEINLAQQPSGIYLVKCVIGSQDIIQKLIINH